MTIVRDVRTLRRQVEELNTQIEREREHARKLLKDAESIARQRDEAIAQRDRYRDALWACANTIGIVRRGVYQFLVEIDAEIADATRTHILGKPK